MKRVSAISSAAVFAAASHSRGVPHWRSAHPLPAGRWIVNRDNGVKRLNRLASRKNTSLNGLPAYVGVRGGRTNDGPVMRVKPSRIGFTAVRRGDTWQVLADRNGGLIPAGDRGVSAVWRPMRRRRPASGSRLSSPGSSPSW